MKRNARLAFSVLMIFLLTACGVGLTPPTITPTPSPTPGPTRKPAGTTAAMVSTSTPSIVATTHVAPRDTGQPVELRLPAGSHLTETAFDPRAGRFYALDSMGTLHVLEGDPLTETAIRSELVAMDEEFCAIGPGWGHCLAVSSVTNRLYVADFAGGQTLVLDGGDLQVIGSIPLTGTLAVNQVSNKILITRTDIGVYVVDGDNHQFLHPIPETIRPKCGMYNPCTVKSLDNPVTQEFYVVANNGSPGSSLAYWVERYAGTTYEKVGGLSECDCKLFRNGVFDRETGFFYSAWHNHTLYPTLAVFDAQMQLVEQLMGIGEKDLALDPDRDRLYLLEDFALAVVDTGSRDVIAVQPLDEHWDTVDIDLDRNRLILADFETARIWPVYPDTLPRSFTFGRGRDLDALEDNILSVAISPAYGKDETVFAGGECGLYKSTDEGDHWRQIVSFNDCDRSYGWDGVIAVSPDYGADQTLFISWSKYGRGRGVFKSSDGGEHWQSASVGLRELNVGQIVLSPYYAYDQTVWATSASYSKSWPLASSTDGGHTWQLVGKEEREGYYPPDILNLVVSPSTGKQPVLYALHVHQCDLCCSTDGGRTWTAWGSALPEGWAETIHLSPTFLDAHTVFVGQDEAGVSGSVHRLYRSTDAGITWQALGQAGACRADQLSTSALEDVWILALSPDYARDRTLFAVDWSSGRLYKSGDGGECWEDTGMDGVGYDSNRFAISPDYTQDQTVFVVRRSQSGNSELYKSVDGGRSWERLGGPGR